MLVDLPYLLFWFDATSSEPKFCVSLEPCCDFMPHEEAVRQNAEGLPKPLQHKLLIHGIEAFSDADKVVFSGWQDMTLALAQSVEERTRALPFDVVPDYEMFAIVPVERAAFVRGKQEERGDEPQQTNVAPDIHPLFGCARLPLAVDELGRSTSLRKREHWAGVSETQSIGKLPRVEDTTTATLSPPSALSTPIEIAIDTVVDGARVRADCPRGDEVTHLKDISLLREERSKGDAPPIGNESEGADENCAIDSSDDSRGVSSVSAAQAEVGSKPKAKKYVSIKSRLLDNGGLKPLVEAQRGKGGLFLKPPGRRPAGFVWDYHLGIWSKSNRDKQAQKENVTGKDNSDDQDETELPAVQRKSSATIATKKDKPVGGCGTPPAAKRSAPVASRDCSASVSLAESSPRFVKREAVHIDEVELKQVTKLRDEMEQEMRVIPFSARSVACCESILLQLLKFPYCGAVQHLRLLRRARKLRKHPTFGALALQLVAKWNREAAAKLVVEWRGALASQKMDTVKANLKSVHLFLTESTSAVVEDFIEQFDLPSLVRMTARLFREKKTPLSQELLNLEKVTADDNLEASCTI